MPRELNGVQLFTTLQRCCNRPENSWPEKFRSINGSSATRHSGAARLPENTSEGVSESRREVLAATRERGKKSSVQRDPFFAYHIQTHPSERVVQQKRQTTSGTLSALPVPGSAGTMTRRRVETEHRSTFHG
jgi:hypothetical protein